MLNNGFAGNMCRISSQTRLSKSEMADGMGLSLGRVGVEALREG